MAGETAIPLGDGRYRPCTLVRTGLTDCFTRRLNQQGTILSNSNRPDHTVFGRTYYDSLRRPRGSTVSGVPRTLSIDSEDAAPGSRVGFYHLIRSFCGVKPMPLVPHYPTDEPQRDHRTPDIDDIVDDILGSGDDGPNPVVR